MAENNIFTMPKFGSNYQQFTQPNVPAAPNLNFSSPQFDAGTYGQPVPTVGPLAGNYTADLARQGIDYQTPEIADPSGGGGFSLGDYTKLGTGVANAYLGYKGLQLGRDQFDFAKNSFNTNLSNQAQLINNQMEDRQRSRLAFSGKYGRDEPGQANLQADLQSYLKPRQVSGAPI